MLTRYVFDIYKATQDTLTIDIPIDLAGRNLPLEFYICKRKDLKKKLEELGDGASMIHNSNAKNYRPDSADKNTFVVMSEHDEISNQLIDKNVGGQLLLNSSGMLQELHITDQKTYNSMSLMMKAVLRLPKSREDQAENEEFHQLLQMVIYMVDLVANLRMSQTVASKCEKSRKKQKQAEQKQKSEEMEDKKIEAKREQDRILNERLKRMTPAEQAKYEEKQKKKENSRMKSKLMKVMK